MSIELSSSAIRTAPLPLGRAVLVLVVVVAAELMDLIDTSVATLAGPSIRADLGGGPMTLQWVLSAYTAAFALGLVTSGRLGDVLGRRRLFLLGMAGFTAASLACGLAPDAGFLIVARVFQGLFGSVMIPQGKQFASAIGVAALGTVFFADLGPSPSSYFPAAELVFGLCAGGYALALLLVGLLPKHSNPETE